jgi:uridine kinase
MDMLIVGIAGGTGSGKTTVVRKIRERFREGEVAILPTDNYYRDNSHLPMEERHKINFDHPDAVEFDLLIRHLEMLKSGQPISLPNYSYLTCSRLEFTQLVEPKHVVIVEGILCLTQPALRDLMTIKVFVDADSDDRLGRVIVRDIQERGRSVENVLERYDHTVKPMHLQFIEPSKRYADLIIPQGGNNEVAIDILVSTISQHLNRKKGSLFPS